MWQRLTPSILITVTLCAIFVSEVFAVHPPESSAIEVGIAEPEASVIGSGGSMSLETGLPLAIYDVGFNVRPGLPTAQARQYLRASAAKLGSPERRPGGPPPPRKQDRNVRHNGPFPATGRWASRLGCRGSR